jgi:hypothetical protein
MKTANEIPNEHTLSEGYLFDQVNALAGMIGPRPAGSRSELLARQYVRHALEALGIPDDAVSEEVLRTPDSWGWPLLAACALALIPNFLPRPLRRVTGWLPLAGAYFAWRTFTARKQPLLEVLPAHDTANLIVTIKPTGEVKQRVVLLGHTDSNKDRFWFSGKLKRYMRAASTFGVSMMLLNGIGLLTGWRFLQRMSFTPMLASTVAMAADEFGAYIAGANDNASAMACLLGIGGQLQQTPLEHTEVWLAFTAAEEVGAVGLHALLDNHREALADAYFIDFEMVGAGEIAYVTDHSGMLAFNNYRPDNDSMALAVETARENPDLNVRGAPLTIVEEVAALRGRGFRGLCIAGVGDDGWLVNWHRSSDVVVNITPKSLERAAHFAWAMLKKLDGKART